MRCRLHCYVKVTVLKMPGLQTLIEREVIKGIFEAQKLFPQRLNQFVLKLAATPSVRPSVKLSALERVSAELSSQKASTGGKRPSQNQAEAAATSRQSGEGLAYLACDVSEAPPPSTASVQPLPIVALALTAETSLPSIASSGDISAASRAHCCAHLLCTHSNHYPLLTA